MTQWAFGKYSALSSLRRLQLGLVLLAIWELLGALAQFFMDSFLLRAHPEGILAGRAFGGDLLVLAVLYIYVARDPLRYRAVIWLAVIEQLAAIVFGVFHLASDNITKGGLILPIFVPMGFLIYLLLHYPRGEEANQSQTQS